MARYQTRTNNNSLVGEEIGFADIILILGVIVNAISLSINSKNNNVLDQINDNLKKINDNLKKINENGSLDIIAQIGSNNMTNVTVEDEENNEEWVL